jgi:hypothetical protein
LQHKSENNFLSDIIQVTPYSTTAPISPFFSDPFEHGEMEDVARRYKENLEEAGFGEPEDDPQQVRTWYSITI